MTYQLPLPAPPEIQQEPHQCWSAAYESWSRASANLIPGAEAVTEEQIEAEMANYPQTLDSQGSATLSGVGMLGHIGNMTLAGLAPEDLSPAWARAQMRRKGYIYLVLYANSANGLFSHAVVIYGTNAQGLMLMDPGPGRGLISRPAAYYRQTIVMLYGLHNQA